MEHDPISEMREALHMVGRDVVGCDESLGDVRSPTDRLGLSAFASEGLAEGDALAQLRTRSQRSNCRLFETALAVLTERQMSFP